MRMLSQMVERRRNNNDFTVKKRRFGLKPAFFLFMSQAIDKYSNRARLEVEDRPFNNL